MAVAVSRRRAAKKKFVLGPEHDGQRMSLDDFDTWPTQEGYLYELGRGVIQVSNVPLPSHGQQVQEIRDQLVLYKLQNPGVIAYMGGGGEAKLLVGSLESERHQDWLVYKTTPPEDTKKVWRYWIPDIVIEVVSKSSAARDYDEKPQEYLEFGVREYWIIDGFKRQVTVLQRYGGVWKKKVVKSGAKYATALLPKFGFDPTKVLGPAKP